MLMPDQGTTPINRSTDKRTQAEDFDALDVLAAVTRGSSVLESPSNAVRVSARARGNTVERNGAIGAERILAKIDPTVVKNVSKTVAEMGDSSAPANTF